MHLAQRAYVLVLLTAVMAIAAIWSGEPGVTGLWRIPAGLLLLGLALEGWFVRRVPIEARLATAPRAFLGRPHAAAFVFANASARTLAVEPDDGVLEPVLVIALVIILARVGTARLSALAGGVGDHDRLLRKIGKLQGRD